MLQMYAKDLDHALRYQPQEREGSQAEDSKAKKQVHCIFNSAALYILGDFICQPIRTWYQGCKDVPGVLQSLNRCLRMTLSQESHLHR